MRIRDLPIEERMRLYNEAWEIRKELGFGFHRTAKKLNIPRDVVRHWFHHGRNPVNEAFRNKIEEKPSPELSYVIGTIMGDGNLIIRKNGNCTSYKIRLRVNHREFAEKFSSCISKLLEKRNFYKIGWTGRQYKVEVCSHQLFDFLKRDFIRLKPFVEDFPIEFIKGIVDSEGSIVVVICRTKRRVWLQPSISITNTNLELLEFIRYLIKKYVGIESVIKSSHKKGSLISSNGKFFKRNKDAFDIKIYGMENLQIFSRKVGFIIKEKQQKLNDIIDIFNNYKPLERLGVWLNSYSKYNNRWVKKPEQNNLNSN